MQTRLYVVVALVALVSSGCLVDDMDTGDQEQGSFWHRENPVVFVHGCYAGPPLAPPPYENSSIIPFWGPMLGAFQANGYDPEDLNVWLYEGAVCGDIYSMAADLADYVDQVRAATGSPRVDLVVHSMGGLIARAYIKWWGGRFKVRDVVILAGTNHGTEVVHGLAESWQDEFGYPAYQGALQMEGAYSCFGESAGNLQFFLNGCLTEDGRTVRSDETPGAFVDYLNIYLTNDEINVPQHTACLDQQYAGDCSGEVNVPISDVQPLPEQGLPAHVAILFDPDVISMTYDHLQNRGWW